MIIQTVVNYCILIPIGKRCLFDDYTFQHQGNMNVKGLKKLNILALEEWIP